MASDASNINGNGTYITMHTNGYPVQDQAYSSNGTTPAIQPSTEFISNTAGNDSNGGGSGGGADIPPAEVGWYFVEQYYTTLSKSPEKLFLYYNKGSQYVSGEETAKVAVCVGQKAINERIKELDFQECKVRVTNVDSQGSGSNIVIQVIGEMSVRKQPSRKFCQTFVLAEQKTGYFVLNDIFRQIIEEDDGEPEEADEETQIITNETTSGHQESELVVDDIPPDTQATSAEQAEITRDADIANSESDNLLKPEAPLAESDFPDKNRIEVEGSSEIVPADNVPAALASEEPDPQPTTEIALPTEAEPMLEAEKEITPESETIEPTTAAPAAPASLAAPAKPEAPKTWAKMVAGNKFPPAVPVTNPVQNSNASPAAPAPARSPVAPATPSAPTASAAGASPPDTDQAGTPQSSGSEWQTAGPEHSRKQSKTQTSQVPANNARGYIKNVMQEIDFQDLKQAMAQYGELQYFDINRSKNAAFVDWETPAAYQAAVAANPHHIGGRRIVVEERIVRPGSVPYNRGRPGRGGRGGFERGVGTSRGGLQRDNSGRGGYSPRGRGSMTPRGESSGSHAA